MRRVVRTEYSRLVVQTAKSPDSEAGFVVAQTPISADSDPPVGKKGALPVDRKVPAAVGPAVMADQRGMAVES